MFARLRKRFVLITVAAVAAGLLCVGAAINIANYFVTTNDLDSLLTAISQDEDDWDFDERSGIGQGRTLRGFSDRGGRFQDAETPYSIRWFSVRVTANGAVVDVDLSHIASVTVEDLPTYAAIVADSSGFGFSGNFRYLVVKDNEASATGIATGYFLGASEELYQMQTLLWTTIIVGIITLGIVLAIIIGVSSRVIAPLVEADRRQKRFVTDASHELKTPLTVIRTSLAMLQLESQDADNRQKWIDMTEHSVDRIASLVDDMVTLARVDEEVGQHETSFDAASAVRQTASEFEDHALASNHDLTITTPQELPYKGDENGVKRLVSVLLDNAIRYAAPGSAISLTLESASRNSLRVICDNAVEDFDSSVLDHLFDRFYRPDESRTKATGGFGIGLSIARSVCEASGGEITVTMPDESTIRFIALMK